jgi:hypothetical protein
MPTNLPPEYYEVDKRYRAAETTSEKIILLEELLGTIPKHKGTEHLRGDLKARLARLKAAQQSKKGGSHHASSFHVAREGAGQVAIIGAANTGKSALLRALTNAEPKISDTPFTTWEPLPGMMLAQDVPVQLVDTPALDREYVEPEFFDLLRRSDVILVLLDLQGDPFQQFEDALRLLAENRIMPASLKPQGTTDDRLVYKPLLLVGNKCDDPAAEVDCQTLDELLGSQWPVLPVSALFGRNLEALKQAVVGQLDVIRVYAKPPGEAPDLSAPFVLKAGSTVDDLAAKVHKDFVQHLKSARVWGRSVHDGQMVGRDYILQDSDIVELRA